MALKVRKYVLFLVISSEFRLKKKLEGHSIVVLCHLQHVVSRYNVDETSFDAFCKLCLMALYHCDELPEIK